MDYRDYGIIGIRGMRGEKEQLLAEGSAMQIRCTEYLAGFRS